MAEIIYEITGASQPFSFDLKIRDDMPGIRGRKGHWSASKLVGVRADVAALLEVSGVWVYSVEGSGDDKHNLVSCKRGTTVWTSVFLIDVPDDFEHGPFCSVGIGTGYIMIDLSTPNNDIPIKWRVVGKPCA